MTIQRRLQSVAIVAVVAFTIACGKNPVGPSGPTTPIATPAPQLTSLNVTSGQQGSSINLVLSGSNLTGLTLGFSPATGLAASNIQATGTSVSATLAVAMDAPAGARQVTAR